MKLKRFTAVAVSAVMMTTMLLSSTFLSSAEESGGDAATIQSEYQKYIAPYEGKAQPTKDIVIDAAAYKTFENKPDSLSVDKEGAAGFLNTGETSVLEWDFEATESGLYTIEVTYFPTPFKGGSIERSFYIDGEQPYSQLSNVVLNRVWEDVWKGEEGVFVQDKMGNEIKPQMQEVYRPITLQLRDAAEEITEPMAVYIEKGAHVLKMVATKEECAFKEIRLVPRKVLPSYEQVKAGYQEADYKIAGDPIKIAAEKPDERSSKTIAPVSDRSEYHIDPQDIKLVRLNTIGGTKWQIAGQWLSWEVEVPETGLYTLSLKYLQNFQQGGFVTRRLLIDGEVPFAEANDLQFAYSSNWEQTTLGTKDEPYYFYLTAGQTHTLTMEVSLGGLAEIVTVAQDVLEILNTEYRNILMLTGPTPDLYRDYDFPRTLPDTLANFEKCYNTLEELFDKMNELSGGRGALTSTLEKINYTLEKMYTKPREIVNYFSIYQSNLSELGTWIQNIRLQPLTLDTIQVTPAGSQPEKLSNNFFSSVGYGVASFVSSFFMDYDSLGVMDENTEKSITVWAATGRDQLQIIRSLINESFTQRYGISVNLQLTAPGTLLPATVSGIGPDVSLTNPQGDPINFAIRGAVLDLSQFEDLEEILKRFPESAVSPLQFEGKTYALPETLGFPMFFYRTDVFEKLKLEPPETWEDFYRLIPILQKNNLQLGMLNSRSQGSNVVGTGLFLYQNGGEFYNEDGTACMLDSDTFLSAFKDYANLFKKYSLPVEYSFANRFRSGEMPAAIADYSNYNMLTVFAPEIKGLWKMVPVPGVMDEEGNVNNVVPSSTAGAMILKSAKDVDSSWEFLKWWTSAEVQSSFGSEMESVLGPSAKYSTANMEALGKMSWTTEEYNNLHAQMLNTKGIPEVPGGYYLSRYMDFAFNHAVIYGEKPIDAIVDYADIIDDEILRKREQLHLVQ